MTPHDLILLLLGLIPAIYWGKVIEMAGRSRRRAGRSANFVPPEPLGRLLRLIWIPAVLAWIAAPFLAALWRRAPWLVRPLHESTPLAGAALAIALIALIATFICWRRMGKAWRMGIDPGEKNPLVTSGPFSVVRHPIYALSTLLMCATALAVCSPLILIAAAIHLPLLQWESTREERHMLRLYGDSYQHYCQKVGRFVPRLRVFSQSKAEAA